MCDKIFFENPQVDEKKLIKELEKKFQVDKIILIPWNKKRLYWPCGWNDTIY